MDAFNAVVAVGNLVAGLLLLLAWGHNGKREVLVVALVNLLLFSTNAYFAVS